MQVHLPQASVHEALHFSARLRLPTTVDGAIRDKFVEEILQLVELDRIGGAFVGVPGVSGLSVEQRKRLTLAVELVANPSIIFMVGIWEQGGREALPGLAWTVEYNRSWGRQSVRVKHLFFHAISLPWCRTSPLQDWMRAPLASLWPPSATQ